MNSNLEQLFISDSDFIVTQVTHKTPSCQLTSPLYLSHHGRCVLHRSTAFWSCQHPGHMFAALSESPQAVPLTGNKDLNNTVI